MKALRLFLAGAVLFSPFSWLSSAAGATQILASPSGMPTDASTKVEFIFSAESIPLKPEDERKGLSPFELMQLKLSKNALEQGIRMSADFLAQYPACHFHIIQISPEPLGLNNTNTTTGLTMRVTLIGDSGCLVSNK